MRRRTNVRCFGTLAASALLAVGCSDGGAGEEKPVTNFSLTFVAPDGSGLAGGKSHKYSFQSKVRLDYDLTAGIDVAGRVSDGLGTPLPGVKIEFRTGPNTAVVDDDTTDGAGDYSVSMGKGTWAVVLDGPDALGTLVIEGVGVAGPGPVVLDFQYPPVSAVTGTVFEEGGPPIAGALLDFQGRETGAEVSAVADGAGFYSADLVPDTYDVVVTPAGGSAATHLKQRIHAIVVAGAVARDFSLAAGVQLSGIVLDDLGGALLESTTVRVELPKKLSSFYAPPEVTASDVDGSYSIGPVPAGSVQLELEPPGDTGFPRQRLPLQVAGPTTQTYDPMLAAGVLLNGTILEDDAATAADAEVTAIPVDGSLAPSAVDTDGAGQFETSLFPGTYDLALTPHDPGDMQLPETRRVTVAVAATHDVTLTRGVTLTGTVTQPGGAVQEPDVRVEIAGLAGASDVTDGSGDYSLLAPVGTHTLSLTAVGGVYEHVALDPVAGVVVAAPGPVTRDIEMVPATSGEMIFEGQVFEPGGVTPVAGARITARNSKDRYFIRRAFSAADGSYVLVIQ